MGDIYVDDLVIGATFWGIGYAVGAKGSALILEKSIRLGHEFIDCFKFGDDWDCSCLTQEGEALKEELKCRNIISAFHKPILQACCPALSQIAAYYHVNLLLGTRVLTIGETTNGYVIEAFNASGIIKIYAKNVLDTTHAGSTFERKSINAMLKCCNQKAEGVIGGDFELHTGERPDVVYVKFFVPEQESFVVARRRLYDQLYTNNQKLKNFMVISVATGFDYHYSVSNQAGFSISGSFTNPVSAFDAGVLAGKAGGSK